MKHTYINHLLGRLLLAATLLSVSWTGAKAEDGAAEAYAVLDGTTLYFYYDDQKSANGGMDINNSYLDYNTGSPYSTATTAVFDSSFANYRPTSTAFWFMYCSSLSSISGIENLKTDNVTSMYYMFYGCFSLKSLDLSGFNTQNVTDMNYMFYNCSSLTSLDLSSFNTQNVTDMSNMFRMCDNLKSLDVSSFNTQNVTYMYEMFESCSNLTSLDLSSFNTQNVTRMSEMFRVCPNLTTIYVGSGWTTAAVRESTDMFLDCTSLVGGAGTTFDTSHTDAEYARIDGGLDSQTPGYFTAKSIAGGLEIYAIEKGATVTPNQPITATQSIIVTPGNDTEWTTDGNMGPSTKPQLVLDVSQYYGATGTYSFGYSMKGTNTPKDGELTTNESTGEVKNLGTYYRPRIKNLPHSGSYVVFETSQDGSLIIPIRVPATRAIYVTDGSGNAMTDIQIRDDSGNAIALLSEPLCAISTTEEFNGFVSFNAKQGEKYYVFVNSTAATRYGGYAFSPEAVTINPATMANVLDLVEDPVITDMEIFHANAALTVEPGRAMTPTQNVSMTTGTDKEWTKRFLVDGETQLNFTASQYYPSSSTTYAFDYSIQGTNGPKDGGLAEDGTNTGSSYDYTKQNLPQSGGFVIYEASKDGSLIIPFSLNANKPIYVVDANGKVMTDIQIKDASGQPMALLADPLCVISTTDASTGFLSFNVKQGEQYYVFGSGTKARFSGYVFKDQTIDIDPATMANVKDVLEGTTAAVAEPYAILSDDQTTLTFFYDDQKSAKNGMGIGPFSNPGDRRWESVAASVTTVKFDESMANCTSLTSTAYWFYGFQTLTTVTGIGNLKTDNVTDMQYMFHDCNVLTSIDVTGFNTTNVTNMRGMFYKCQQLQSIDLSSFNTALVTDMSWMFYGCNALTKIYAGSEWTAEGVVTDEDNAMFMNCTKLVGGAGTTYDETHADHTYAHIDGGIDNPGYFTELIRKTLTADDYFEWNGMGAGATKKSETPSRLCNYYIGQSAEVPYGDPNVSAYAYADLSAYDRLEITATAGTPRILLNRDAEDGYWNADESQSHQIESTQSGWSSKYFSHSGNVWTVDLKQMVADKGFAHLNAIKGDNWSAVTITKMELVKGIVENTSAEPYAVLSDNNTVLTFFYDDQKETRGGFSIKDQGGGNHGTATAPLTVAQAIALIDAESTISEAYVKGKISQIDSYSDKYKSITYWISDDGGTTTQLQVYSGKGLNGADFTAKEDLAIGQTVVIKGALKMYNTTYEFDKTSSIISIDGAGSRQSGSRQNRSSITDYAETITKVVFDESFANYYPTSTANWFQGCTSLAVTSGIENLKTDNVTNMNSMFATCTSLTSLDLRYFKTNNVRNMRSMFSGCSSLTTIYVGSRWSTTNVTESAEMFNGCTSIIGGAGTTYDANHIDKTYARIDGGTSAPGYLTEVVTKVATPTFSWNGDQLTMTTETEDADIYFSVKEYDAEPAGDGSESNPYNVAGVLKYISTLGADVQSEQEVYVKGVVSSIQSPFDTTYGNAVFNVSDNGKNQNYLTAYRALYLQNQRYTSGQRQIQVGDDVVLFGKVVNYKGSTPETVSGAAYLYSMEEPDLQNRYENPITVSGNVVIRAKATKQGLDDSDLAMTYSGTEPYAVLSDNNTVLTFRYDDQKRANGGMGVGPFGVTFINDENAHNVTGREWEDYVSTIRTVAFDPSFANCSTIFSTAGWFCNDSNLVAIRGIEYLKTDNVMDMTGMFCGCKSLTSIDLSHFNTSNVTNMWAMFNRCESFTTFNLEQFNTSKVTDMRGMFYGCSSLTNLDLSHFDVSSVKYFNSMFRECTKLENLNLTGWMTSSALVMQVMFGKCESLKSIDLSGFDTSNATNLLQMFYGCRKLKSLDLSNFKTPKVTAMHGLFYRCEALESLDVSSLNPSEVTDLHSIFFGCTSLKNLDVSHFDTSKATNMDYLFARCYSLTNLNISGFNTADVTSMANMFNYCSSLASIQAGNAAIPDSIYAQIGNPNLLLYVNEASLAPASVTNVVVNGAAENIVLTDVEQGNNNFYCPQEFTAHRISYTHNYRQATQVGVSRGWETIVLPFTVQTITHEKNGPLAPFGVDGGKPFWLRQLTENGLVSAQHIEANMPYLISMPNNGRYPADYNQAGNVTFSANNVVVPMTEQREMSGNNRMLIPTTMRVAQSPSVYAINRNASYENNPEGSIFVADYREVRPFEAYVEHTNGARFFTLSDLAEGDVTDIQAIHDIASADVVKVYNLSGVLLKTGKRQEVMSQLPKGIYIVNGVKVVVK